MYFVRPRLKYVLVTDIYELQLIIEFSLGKLKTLNEFTPFHENLNHTTQF